MAARRDFLTGLVALTAAAARVEGQETGAFEVRGGGTGERVDSLDLCG